MLWGIAFVTAACWLWFLARGTTRGLFKRLALRATLLAAAALLIGVANSRGVFLRSTAGFRFALVLALLTVEVGYLYTIRFCVRCGRMVRNLKAPECPRCHELLPRHGMTLALRRPGDDERWDPLAPRKGRSRGRR